MERKLRPKFHNTFIYTRPISFSCNPHSSFCSPRGKNGEWKTFRAHAFPQQQDMCKIQKGSRSQKENKRWWENIMQKLYAWFVVASIGSEKSANFSKSPSTARQTISVSARKLMYVQGEHLNDKRTNTVGCVVHRRKNHYEFSTVSRTYVNPSKFLFTGAHHSIRTNKEGEKYVRCELHASI